MRTKVVSGKEVTFVFLFGRLSRNLYLCWTEIENGKERYLGNNILCGTFELS